MKKKITIRSKPRGVGRGLRKNLIRRRKGQNYDKTARGDDGRKKESLKKPTLANSSQEG